MFKIGIIGLGVVGNAIYQVLDVKNKSKISRICFNLNPHDFILNLD